MKTSPSPRSRWKRCTKRAVFTSRRPPTHDPLLNMAPPWPGHVEFDQGVHFSAPGENTNKKGENMDKQLEKVKNYHLFGDGVKIEFSSEDPTELKLVYEDKEGIREFSGREIYRDDTRLGFIASVGLEAVPDVRTTTLSVAIPDANRPENAKSIPVKTFAVQTTSRTGIAGPDAVEGQVQLYKTIGLEGNAW